MADDVLVPRFTAADGRFAVVRDWRTVVAGTLEPGARLQVRFEGLGSCDEVEEADVLLDGLAELGGAVELDVRDPLVRHAARARGFEGDLRGPLTAATVGPNRPPTRLDPAGVAATLAELLPGTEVRALGSGSAGGFLRRSTYGTETLRFELVRGDDRWVVPAPWSDHLMVEALARSIDVAMSVRARFPVFLANLRELAFDLSDGGFGRHETAGVAHGNLATAKVNAAYVDTRRYTRLRHALIVGASSRPPAQVAPPWTSVEGTVVHELWHLVDHQLQASRYKDTIELRRRLGAYFGVETIEHVIQATKRDLGVAPREGLRRLVTEVSPYAATNPTEATAELFKLWWCRGPEPSGAVRHFGAVLDELFP